MTLIEVWCDVGGTFTDCFVVLPSGERQSIKTLSSGLTKGKIDAVVDRVKLIDVNRRAEVDDFWNGATLSILDRDGERVWSTVCLEHESSSGWLRLAEPIPSSIQSDVSQFSYELDAGLEAPVLATRLLLKKPLSDPLPKLSVRLGTTRGTNALLTRHGAATAFITSKGFRDALLIGYQERPDLFSLNITKRPPLYREVVEADERLAADGSVLIPLDELRIRESLLRLKHEGIESLAVSLVHAYRFPDHEQRIEAIAREIGFSNISCSHRIAPFIKLISRSETTVVDAYLGPIIRDYLGKVARQFGSDSQLSVMTSSGSLVDAPNYHGKDCVLSGPAGGAVALTRIAEAIDQRQLIGLDMGGTSTDVCRIDGAPIIEYETVKAGVRMMTPMLAIHTVAAGGGSICSFDGVQWHVGPQSAGSDPGPACYGRGGPLTVTDLNLLAGRLIADAFPFELDIEASRRRLDELMAMAKIETNDESRSWVVSGLRRIANELMAAAVRKISIAQGADPRMHGLVGFGGAAGQHICEIAELLKVELILDPPEAGLLSALGMGLASVGRWTSQGIYRPLADLKAADLEDCFGKLEEEGRRQLFDDGYSAETIRSHRWIECRYVKTDQALSMTFETFEVVTEQFHSLHQKRFGYHRDELAVEVVAIRVESVSVSKNKLTPIHSVHNPVAHSNESEIGGDGHTSIESRQPRPLNSNSELWIHQRDSLLPGFSSTGRASSSRPAARPTSIVDGGWKSYRIVR